MRTIIRRAGVRSRDGAPHRSWSGRRVGATVVFATLALIPSACSGSDSGATSTPTRPSLHLTGTGDKSSTRIALPAKWTATWHFTCRGAEKGEPFALTAASTSRPDRRINVIRQSGLSGGGQKDYATRGTYVFSVATPCDWTLDVARKSADAARPPGGEHGEQGRTSTSRPALEKRADQGARPT
jgi:hypothetical protein